MSFVNHVIDSLFKMMVNDSKTSMLPNSPYIETSFEFQINWELDYLFCLKFVFYLLDLWILYIQRSHFEADLVSLYEVAGKSRTL